MPGCAAVNCNKRDAVYRFPVGNQDKSRLQQWLHNVGRTNFNHEKARLCKKHFNEDQFEMHRADGKQKLKKTAVPTIFDHRPIVNARKLPAKRKRSPSLSNCPSEIPTSSTVQDVTTDIIDVQDDNNGDKMKDLGCEELRNKLKQEREKVRKLKLQISNHETRLKNFLNEDQLQVFKKKEVSGFFKWSDLTIQKALKIRVACGSNGYNLVKELGQPLPSERTLQRRMEGICFEPGILHELLPSIELKISSLKPEERHAILMIDEMALQAGVDFDSTNESIIGYPTLPTAHGKFDMKPASHALVFMLGGVTSRWKQTIGYHFTGLSYEASSVKKIIFEIVRKCGEIGIEISAVVSDMGGHNQALWRECGIVTGRYSKIVNFCTHSLDESKKLYFMPDVPHIFKNIRNHLTENQDVYLPADVVQQNQLPTNIVSIKHIVSLVKLSDKLDLKLAPLLRQSVLTPNHFEKMKVGLALALINNTTAAALRTAVTLNKLEEEALTTAWFIDQVFQWFKIMTSRHVNMSLNGSEDVSNQQAIHFLENFKSLFENLQIGQVKHWKPVQSGVMLATKTSLDLLNYYCQEKKHKFVLLSRFSQDALENLFSTVRNRNPVPKCKEFKSILRLITLSQFFRPSNAGSYFHDDAQYLIEFVSSSDKNADPASERESSERFNLENQDATWEDSDNEFEELRKNKAVHIDRLEEQSLHGKKK